MTKKLEYIFKSDSTRGTPLEIRGSKTFIDEALAASAGPLNDGARAGEGDRFFWRTADGDGNAILDFDMSARSTYFRGGANRLSSRTLLAISQLDRYAQRRNAGDPRINIISGPIESSGSFHRVQVEDDNFGITFEQPNVKGSEELAAKIHAGMVRAAKVTFLYETGHHSRLTVANVLDDGVIEINMGPFPHMQRRPILVSQPVVAGDRVEFRGVHGYGADHERLVALLGIISVLEPINPDAA
jgi:hypothetical protein